MRGLRGLDEALRDLLQLGRAELTLRLAILASTVCFLVVVALAGSLAAWAAALGLLLGALTMLAPVSEAGLVTTFFLLGVWYFGVQDSPWTLWTPAAALSLLALHVTTSAAGRSPVAGGLAAGSLGRWTLRTLIVGGVTVAAFLLGWAFSRVDAAGSLVLATAAGVLVAALLLAARRWALTGPRRQVSSAAVAEESGGQADSLR